MQIWHRGLKPLVQEGESVFTLYLCAERLVDKRQLLKVWFESCSQENVLGLADGAIVKFQNNAFPLGRHLLDLREWGDAYLLLDALAQPVCPCRANGAPGE